MSSWKRTRAQLAAEVRHNGPDSSRAADLRRELRASRAGEYLREVIAGWPPLSARQLAGLSDILAEAARDVSRQAEQKAAGAPERGAA